MSDRAQLAFKQAQLLESLSRIGGVTPREILPPLTASTWQYRRRARLGVKYVARKGRVLVGFRERSARYVADLHGCGVLAPPAGDLIDPLATLVQSLSIAERLPQIEVAVAENVCALVLRVLSAPNGDDLERLRAFERERGVRIYLQSGGIDTVTPLSVRFGLAHLLAARVRPHARVRAHRFRPGESPSSMHGWSAAQSISFN